MNQSTSLLRRAAYRVGGLLGGPAVLGTAGGFAGSWWWGLDLLAHFRVYYAVALFTAVGLCLLGQPRRWVGWAGAGLFAMALAVNVTLIAPLYRAPPSNQGHLGAAHPDDLPLRLLHFNVHTSNPNHDGVIQSIDQSGAAVVFLQEISAGWLADLYSHAKHYRVQVAYPKQDNFGIAMLVPNPLVGRLSIVSARVVDFSQGMGDLPAIEAVVDWQGRRVMILSLHTLPPVGPGAAHIRDTQLAAVGRWASQQTLPVVIIGDFNATRWSVGYRLLKGQTDLLDAQRGYGYCPTFPSRGPVRIPIDLCLHSPALVTVGYRVGPSHGSDHHSLRVDLAWRRTQDAAELSWVRRR